MYILSDCVTINLIVVLMFFVFFVVSGSFCLFIFRQLGGWRAQKTDVPISHVAYVFHVQLTFSLALSVGVLPFTGIVLSPHPEQAMFFACLLKHRKVVC